MSSMFKGWIREEGALKETEGALKVRGPGEVGGGSGNPRQGRVCKGGVMSP